MKTISQTQETKFWRIGEKYFVRTVTHHLTGELVAVDGNELIFIKAAWIADDGRFMNAVEKGDFSEVEPFPPDRLVLLGRLSIIDAVQIPVLPSIQR